jgi:hypothetical protein
MGIPTKILKMFERKNGIKHVTPSRESKTLKCGAMEFEIFVAPGQIINARKMCKKLLKAKYNQNNEQEKKFVSKGYKGQNTY